MQDLYRGFKKVSEDDNHAVLEHEQGHRLNIAKSGLSKKHLRNLSNLPLHQAQGTPIEENEMQSQEFDSGDALKNIGAQITEAVAQKVIEGAEESISPEQIEQMPEPTATDIQTGQPVYKAPGATPSEPSTIMQQGGSRKVDPANLPVGPLDVYGEILSPGGATLTYEQAKQIAEEKKAQQLAAQEQAQKEPSSLAPGETGPGILGATAPSAEAPSLAAEQPTPQVSAPETIQPVRRLDLTRPVLAPTITKTPEEIMVDPNASEFDRANAFIMAAQNVQQRIENADKQFQEELRKPENQINPDRFYENMSTGRKIRTIIGLILGGAAGGILKQENPVLAMLNKQIDMDIEAQKASRADKYNLYKQNLEVLRDGRAAYFQTASQLRSLVDMKLQDAQLKLDPTNQAGKLALQAAMAENRTKLRQAQNELTKIELRKTYSAAAQKGDVIEMPDELDDRLESAVRVTDNKGRPVKLYARSKGMVNELQKRADAISTAENALKRVVDFNKKYGWQLSVPVLEKVGFQSQMADAAETLNAEVRFAVSNLLSSGQLSERNADLFEDIFPKGGALKQEDAQKKAIQAARLLKDMKDTLIKNNLIR